MSSSEVLLNVPVFVMRQRLLYASPLCRFFTIRDKYDGES